jgi:hypothetical protein
LPNPSKPDETTHVSKNETSPKVRITDQFRSGESMVYDLKCDNIRITISMSSSRQDDQWSAEALAKQAPDPPKIRGNGSSRGEALTVLAEAWRSRGGSEGFPWLDWAAIRDALVAVRAI